MPSDSEDDGRLIRDGETTDPPFVSTAAARFATATAEPELRPDGLRSTRMVWPPRAPSLEEWDGSWPIRSGSSCEDDSPALRRRVTNVSGPPDADERKGSGRRHPIGRVDIVFDEDQIPCSEYRAGARLALGVELVRNRECRD